MMKNPGMRMIAIAAFLAVVSGGALQCKAQTTQAGKPPAAKELIMDLGDQVTLKLILIPPRQVPDGQPDQREGTAGPNEGPQHAVTISKPFYMGVTEVTQAQYETVMGENPSVSKDPSNTGGSGFLGRCRQVLQKGLREDETDGSPAPPRAEWEYACRAGTTTAYSFTGSLPDYAWFLPQLREEVAPRRREEAQSFRAV